jgi:hypothetical protein
MCVQAARGGVRAQCVGVQVCCAGARDTPSFLFPTLPFKTPKALIP